MAWILAMHKLEEPWALEDLERAKRRLADHGIEFGERPWWTPGQQLELAWMLLEDEGIA